MVGDATLHPGLCSLQMNSAINVRACGRALAILLPLHHCATDMPSIASPPYVPIRLMSSQLQICHEDGHTLPLITLRVGRHRRHQGIAPGRYTAQPRNASVATPQQRDACLSMVSRREGCHLA